MTSARVGAGWSGLTTLLDSVVVGADQLDGFRVHSAAILLVLSGLANGTNLDDIAPGVATLASDRSLFPGEALIDLAADIIEASGATREHPIDTTDIRRRLLPEDRAHTKAQHLKAEFAIRSAAMVRAGVDPALDDTVSWWRANDLWLWALEAVVVYARAAAEHADVTARRSEPARSRARFWKPATDRADLVGLRIHDLRHCRRSRGIRAMERRARVGQEPGTSETPAIAGVSSLLRWWA